jgi:hypothetical protein
MPPVYVYSDESSDRDRKRGIFSVAGIAISAHVWAIRNRLQAAERRSGKGDKDWHRTKDPKERRRYIELVLQIPELRGCGFRRIYQHPTDQFEATVETLARVVRRFRGGDRGELCILTHEGFGKATRSQLRSRVRDIGIRDFLVEPGSMAEPRVRLADALAGFSRLVHSTSTMLDFYDGLPYQEWFVDLD